MGRFKKGLFLGGLLGAAMMWLNATPKGKELRSKFAAHFEALYGELEASLKKLEAPTREMYHALVQRAVAEYTEKKELAVEMKELLIKELKKKWKELEREVRRP